jgi:hypothetical protein
MVTSSGKRKGNESGEDKVVEDIIKSTTAPNAEGGEVIATPPTAKEMIIAKLGEILENAGEDNNGDDEDSDEDSEEYSTVAWDELIARLDMEIMHGTNPMAYAYKHMLSFAKSLRDDYCDAHALATNKGDGQAYTAWYTSITPVEVTNTETLHTLVDSVKSFGELDKETLAGIHKYLTDTLTPQVKSALQSTYNGKTTVGSVAKLSAKELQDMRSVVTANLDSLINQANTGSMPGFTKEMVFSIPGVSQKEGIDHKLRWTIPNAPKDKAVKTTGGTVLATSPSRRANNKVVKFTINGAIREDHPLTLGEACLHYFGKTNIDMAPVFKNWMDSTMGNTMYNIHPVCDEGTETVWFGLTTVKK